MNPSAEKSRSRPFYSRHADLYDFAKIGDMVVDDLRQIARGLPPVRMQVAAPELVGRYRNRPVS